jgi:deoxyxylulose-5-phosphate synthase
VIEEVAAGSGIAREIAIKLPGTRVYGMDLGAGFITHGSMQSLYQHCGLDADSIANRILEDLSVEK